MSSAKWLPFCFGLDVLNSHEGMGSVLCKSHAEMCIQVNIKMTTPFELCMWSINWWAQQNRQLCYSRSCTGQNAIQVVSLSTESRSLLKRALLLNMRHLSCAKFKYETYSRNVKLAGYSILDIGHSNAQCPISNIRLTSRSYHKRREQANAHLFRASKCIFMEIGQLFQWTHFIIHIARNFCRTAI